MNWIRKFVIGFFPAWSKGLECEICEMSFVDEKAHLDHARKKRTINKHKDKIPILRR